MKSLLFSTYFLSIKLLFASTSTCGPSEIETNRVVGYWQGKTNITPTQISSLTHVIYAFIPMFPNGSIIVRPWDKHRLDWLQDAKKIKPSLRTMIAIGGAANSQFFPNVVADSNSLELFISTVLHVVWNHDLDGVDVDWEFPRNDVDRANYVQLMERICLGFEELQTHLNRTHRYVLSFASGYDKWTLMRSYDLANLIKPVDFINVMTYDYYAAWEAPTGCLAGPPAPLYGGTWLTPENVDTTMRHYGCTTRELRKLNLGIPFYGRYWNYAGDPFFFDPLFRSAYPSNSGGYCEGNAIAWRDIPKSWNLSDTIFHETSKVPYIFAQSSDLPLIGSGNSRYLGFENHQSIGYKADYAIHNNFGGLMVWAIDQDDDENSLIQAVTGRVSEMKNDNTIVFPC